MRRCEAILSHRLIESNGFPRTEPVTCQQRVGIRTFWDALNVQRFYCCRHFEQVLTQSNRAFYDVKAQHDYFGGLNEYQMMKSVRPGAFR